MYPRGMETVSDRGTLKLRIESITKNITRFNTTSLPANSTTTHSPHTLLASCPHSSSPPSSRQRTRRRAADPSASAVASRSGFHSPPRCPTSAPRATSSPPSAISLAANAAASFRSTCPTPSVSLMRIAVGWSILLEPK